MKKHVMLFVAVAALALLVLGCPVTNSPGSTAASDTTSNTNTSGNSNTGTNTSPPPGNSTPKASLLLPQTTAFAILGYSCGGIQEQAYATGFDPVSGLPTGDVYISTRCGGSGRIGGGHVTTYSAWVGATWDFSGSLVSSARLAAAPTVNPTFTAADAYNDSLYNIRGAAYLVVPVPGAPTGVTAVQSGDQLQVSWRPNGVNPIAVISSTLTATPVSSTGSVLTTSLTGHATSGVIASLQPQTTYQVTVVNSTIGGTGPASTGISVTTAVASIPASAPTGVTAKWSVLDPTGTTDTLVATWTASVPGDSPVDQYQIDITGSDGAGTFTQTVSGTTLQASFTVDFTPNWSVQVRAHNAVGWGPWSTPVTLGGL